jgi:hypothetical protein
MTAPAEPKKTRGRPREFQRQWMEDLPGQAKPEGCLRTKMNFINGLEFESAAMDAPEEEQVAILGHSFNQKPSKGPFFPKGYRTAALEAGRWIKAGGEPAVAVSVVADARRAGISFGDIAAHFRALRLGEKEGDETALLLKLCRALAEYRKTFPKTTNQQARWAVARLLQIIEEREAE